MLPSLGQGLKGGKVIAIDQVSSTQFKKATAFINGYIQFSLQEGAEAKRGGLGAAQDENAIMFTNKQQPGFAKAKELIDLYCEAARGARTGVEPVIGADGVPKVPSCSATAEEKRCRRQRT